MELTADIMSGVYTGKLPGISDLAEKYGVNPLTISRALDDLEQRGLIEKKSRVGTFVKPEIRIGLLYFSDHQMRPDEPKSLLIFNNLHRGIKDALKDKRASFEVYYCTVEDIKQLDIIKQSCDALIVVSTLNVKDEHFRLLDGIVWMRAMGAPQSQCRASHVTYENDAIGKIAAEWLLEQGCDKCFYVGTDANYLMRRRFEVFRACLQEQGIEAGQIEADVNRMPLGEVVENARKSLAGIVKDIERGKTGIFLAADIYATPFYQMLYSFGLQPQKDIKIISCNNNDYYLNGLFPKLPSIDIRMYEVGKRAAEMLLTEKAELCEKVILQPKLDIPGRELVYPASINF
jgi:DNA-binding LacI/PurR family transcriptional regulator